MGFNGIVVGRHPAQFGPQIFIMGVHGSVRAHFRVIPDQIHEHFPGIDPARMTDKKGENFKFIPGQIQAPAVIRDPAPGLVQFKSRPQALGCVAAGGLGPIIPAQTPP